MKVTLETDKMGKLIITVATTGGIHDKSSNPNLPEQPDEIARDVYDCYNAGAAVHHMHVRDKQGRVWYCDAGSNPAADLRGQGCVLADEWHYDRMFGG